MEGSALLSHSIRLKPSRSMLTITVLVSFAQGVGSSLVDIMSRKIVKLGARQTTVRVNLHCPCVVRRTFSTLSCLRGLASEPERLELAYFPYPTPKLDQTVRIELTRLTSVPSASFRAVASSSSSSASMASNSIGFCVGFLDGLGGRGLLVGFRVGLEGSWRIRMLSVVDSGG